jgi:hypothetical protein
MLQKSASDARLDRVSVLDPEGNQLPGKAVLAADEHIERAYQLIQDLFIFTNKRLLLVDKQGLTGNKVEYHSLPYKNITHFSVETAGHFDLDTELKILWISGSPIPIQKQFNKKLNIYEVQSVLAGYVF